MTPSSDRPSLVALAACTLLAIGLLIAFGIYARPLIELPADLLMFSETAFVENMIKLNTDQPLYTPPEDSNSIVYNPGAYLVTHLLASLTGLTHSVPGLRVIQLLYALLAALIATRCARVLRAYAFPEAPTYHPAIWVVFTAVTMMLLATAPHVNRYTFSLHVDALALLASMACFWSLVSYYRHESRASILAMVVTPTLAFLAKQSLVTWLPLLVLGVLLRGRTHIRTGVIVAIAGGLLVAVATFVCYQVWGEAYGFWVFTVLSARTTIALGPAAQSISVARSLDHLLRAWPDITIGIAGLWYLMKSHDPLRRIAPLAVVWALLLASEAYSSSSGWGALYHFGPGVMVGAAFVFAGLPILWYAQQEPSREAAWSAWGRALARCCMALAIFSVWNVVPTGNADHPRYGKKFERPTDVYRYITAVEREFEGLPPEKVLLGVGSWRYLAADVLQKDRAVSMADQPPGGIYENFNVTLERLRRQAYDKILLQDFHTAYFLYDWGSWERSPGFRTTLLAYYDEVATIPPAHGSPYIGRDIQMVGPVSVFVPKRR